MKIQKDATLKIKYHEYGENLERGAIGKSNVEAGPDFKGKIWLKKYYYYYNILPKISLQDRCSRLVCEINVQDQLARSIFKTSLQDQLQMLVCKTDASPVCKIDARLPFLERTTCVTFQAMCTIIFRKCMEDQKAARSPKYPFTFHWHIKIANLVLMPFPYNIIYIHSFIHKQNIYIHIINSCVNTKLFHDVFSCINTYKLKNTKVRALHNPTWIYEGLAT